MLRTFVVIGLAAVAPTLLSACSDAPSATAETYTVDQLMVDDPRLKQLLADCANNPGELGLTPNCINASEAKRKLTYEALARKAKE